MMNVRTECSCPKQRTIFLLKGKESPPSQKIEVAVKIIQNINHKPRKRATKNWAENSCVKF